MTVSPNRPTDGSCPLQGGNGPRQDGSELPPVLFRLPNLGTAGKARASKPTPLASAPPHTHVPAPFAETPATGTSAAETCAAETCATETCAAETCTAKTFATEAFAVNSVASHQPAFNNPTSASFSDHSPSDPSPDPVRGSVHRAARIDDRPAGRTWTEAAVAHRNVLVMLAIVVAVALWTSRRAPETTEIESVLAREGIAMDEGVAGIAVGGAEEFSVSMGEPTADQPGAAPSSPSPSSSFAMETLSSPLNAPEIGGTSQQKMLSQQNVASKPMATAAVTSPAGGRGNVQSTDFNSFDEASVSASAFSSSDNSNASASRFSDGTFGGGVPATAVVSRRPSDSVGLPSLDELESEPALAGEALLSGYGGGSSSIPSASTSSPSASSPSGAATGASLGVPTATPRPIPSSTPNGVVDWLKYAPAYPSTP